MDNSLPENIDFLLLEFVKGTLDQEQKTQLTKLIEQNDEVKEMYFQTRSMYEAQQLSVVLPAISSVEAFKNFKNKVSNPTTNTSGVEHVVKATKALSIKIVSIVVATALVVATTVVLLLPKENKEPSQTEEKTIIESDTLQTSNQAIDSTVEIEQKQQLETTVSEETSTPKIETITTPKEIITSTEITQAFESLTIAEGVTVFLNENSKLIWFSDYSFTFTGELYLENTSSKKITLKAFGDKIEILDQGEYNVKSYNDHVELTVKKGKAAKGKIVATNDMILFSGANNVKNLLTQDPNYLSWKTKIISFTDTPLREVISTLNSVYKVDITNEILDESACRFTANFNNTPLEEVLEVLELSLGVTIEKENKQIVLRGANCE